MLDVRNRLQVYWSLSLLSMATANPSLTSLEGRRGYSLDIFPGGNVDHKYLCAICNLVLRNPVQRFCGHRYCSDCFEQNLGTSSNGTSTCPACVSEGVEEEEFEEGNLQPFPDNAIKREMISLEVQCPHPGCEWIGKFKDFTEHFEEHSVPDSGRRCPLECQTPLDEGSDVDDHIRSALPQHLEILHNRLRVVETQSQAEGRSSLEGRVREVEQRLGNMRRQIESASTAITSQAASSPAAAAAHGPADMQVALSMASEKLPILEGVLTVLNRELEKLTGDFQSMERQRRLERELLDNMDRKARSLERVLAMKEAAIAELTVKVAGLEQSNYDGTLLLRVTEVAAKRQEAVSGRTTSIYSPPFYTSRTGYKMCLRVYLNGDGMGKGTHLSVFFVVKRGNYDALLRWPFRQKVTFTLLNQSQRDNIVEAFRPDPSSSSFKRPTTEMNIASGCPMLAPLEVLEDPARGFVKDDQLFLKVHVDTSDL